MRFELIMPKFFYSCIGNSRCLIFLLYFQLLTAYTSVIECSGLVAWAKYAEKLEVVAVDR